RMLAGFRNRAPQRNGLIKSILDLMRLRPIQITAVACVLLALVQVGRMITGESETTRLVSVDAIATDRRDQSGVRGSDEKKDISGLGNTQGKPSAPASAQAEGGRQFREELAARSRIAPIKAPTAGAGANKKTEAYAVDSSNLPTGEEARQSPPTETPNSALANRKLIRNAQVELEIASFDATVQKITAFANEEKGYVATTNSEKQANGKLKGEIIVKVLPENLDRFLQKIRGLGELKNQQLGTEDVTKAYFDTDARLKNSRVMEQRLIDMLKTKTGKVADLLQVEKELGRVREEIEKMQGDLKYWDSQVQFATVTIQLAEKDLEEPARFLIKERAQLALYAPDVEKTYNEIKGLTSHKVQITNAQLDRDYSGRISARLSILIAPEESDAVIGRVKDFGRVENFQSQIERIAQDGEGMSENAKTKRDKVELNITISRDEQEQALLQTSLRIRAGAVDEKSRQLRQLTEKQNGRVRSSTFSRDPDGREIANVSLRVPMKDYNALMQSLNSLGKVENVSVQRQDRTSTQIDEANAPADLSIQIYSQGNIVSSETGVWATLRNTLAQGAAALMWSLRMIGVAVAFLAPWVVALVAIVWIAKRIARARRYRFGNLLLALESSRTITQRRLADEI
ncbi:MAG: DUF4349 domain-containing protein, partial [Chthoniobacterales bacterium]